MGKPEADICLDRGDDRKKVRKDRAGTMEERPDCAKTARGALIGSMELG